MPRHGRKTLFCRLAKPVLLTLLQSIAIITLLAFTTAKTSFPSFNSRFCAEARVMIETISSPPESRTVTSVLTGPLTMLLTFPFRIFLALIFINLTFKIKLMLQLFFITGGRACHQKAQQSQYIFAKIIQVAVIPQLQVGDLHGLVHAPSHLPAFPLLDSRGHKAVRLLAGRNDLCICIRFAVLV